MSGSCSSGIRRKIGSLEESGCTSHLPAQRRRSMTTRFVHGHGPWPCTNRGPTSNRRRTQAQQVHSSSPCSSTPAPTQRLAGECCKGVPAALQPVQHCSHSMRVTVRDGCAAGRSTVDIPSTSRPSTGVPRNVSTLVPQPLHRPTVAHSCGRKQLKHDRHRPLGRPGAAGLIVPASTNVESGRWWVLWPP